MIEVTDEMTAAYVEAWDAADLAVRNRPQRLREALAAVLAIVERDWNMQPRPAGARLPPRPKPRRRLRACVERWPDAETGTYDPRCCRWPKSCSADVYSDEYAPADLLEPPP